MDILTVGTTLYSNVSVIRNLTGDCQSRYNTTWDVNVAGTMVAKDLTWESTQSRYNTTWGAYVPDIMVAKSRKGSIKQIRLY